MERAEYRSLDTLEDRMWWFIALHRNLLMLARRISVETSSLPILDAGCGTGGFLVRLGEMYRGRQLLGLDLDFEACRLAANKSDRPVCAGSVNDLPFADCSIAMIFAADVLCHRAVDESRALQQFHRCLADDSCLILNLPAYRWLLSRHDAAVHNMRRYTASGLRRLLSAAGFRPIYVSYWNTVLFPLMATFRKLFPGDLNAGSDVKPYPAAVDGLCRVATGFETALLRRDLRLPFGGSVLAIAAKRGTSHE
jgi:SAM-dependent methyltransferase